MNDLDDTLKYKIVKYSVCILPILAIMISGVVYWNTIRSSEIRFQTVPESTDKLDYSIEYAGVCIHAPEIIEVANSKNSPYYLMKSAGNYDNYMDITGWACIRGEDIALFKTEILLKDAKKNDNIFIRVATEGEYSSDLTNFFADGSNYDYAKFTATVSRKRLSSDLYDIYLWYKNNENDYLVKTNKKLDLMTSNQ